MSVPTMTGWAILEDGTGHLMAAHTSGFFISGFESRMAATAWLAQFILHQQAAVRADNLERDRILAEMPVHGRVS